MSNIDEFLKQVRGKQPENREENEKISQTTLSLDHERSRAVSGTVKLCTRSRFIVTEKKNNT